MKLHWLHADCLNAEWFPPSAGPAVFVFDERQLEADRWSLKRIGFVYECLLEMPQVEIWRGPIAETLAGLVDQRNLESVLTIRTPDPWLQAQAVELQTRGVTVEWTSPEPFVRLPGDVDLRRFSRYWQKAQPVLFS